MKIAFLTIFAAALLSASVGASESTGVDGIRLGILNPKISDRLAV